MTFNLQMQGREGLITSQCIHIPFNLGVADAVGVKVEVESPASPVYVSSDGCVTLHATWLGPQHHANCIPLSVCVCICNVYTYLSCMLYSPHNPQRRGNGGLLGRVLCLVPDLTWVYPSLGCNPFT